MTVKDIIQVLPFAERLTLVVGDDRYELNKNDAFQMDAYGSYKVAYIDANGETGNTCTDYDVYILMQPVKGGDII